MWTSGKSRISCRNGSTKNSATRAMPPDRPACERQGCAGGLPRRANGSVRLGRSSSDVLAQYRWTRQCVPGRRRRTRSFGSRQRSSRHRSGERASTPASGRGRVMHAGWRWRSRVAGTQDVPRSRCDRQTVRGSRSIHGGSIPDRRSGHRLRRVGTLLEPARAARRPRGFASRRDLRRTPRVRPGPERRTRSRPRQVRSELEPRSTRHRAWEGEGSRPRALPPEQHARGRAAECRMTRTGTGTSRVDR